MKSSPIKSNQSNHKSRKWIREASMRRLSLLVKDKTASISAASKMRLTIETTDGLEESGLSPIMKDHLKLWVEGVLSGRQCMLALLDALQSESSLRARSSNQAPKSSEFQPLDLVRSLLHLPVHFLCDAGYLYDSIFSRAPAIVMKEALETIVARAYEQSSSSLGLQQINVALKQLKLNALQSKEVATEDLEQAYRNEQHELFRAQIMIELLKIYIDSTIQKKHQTSLELFQVPRDTTKKHAEEDFYSVLNSILPPKPPSQGKYMNSNKSNVVSSPLILENVELQRIIEQYLKTSLPTLAQELESSSTTSLANTMEELDSQFKPYLTQLSQMKGRLSDSLKDIQQTKAFLIFGLTPDCTEEMIKKAYKKLAVKLHPDKRPYGNKEKFQALQVSYHEILAKKKSMASEEEAFNELFTSKGPTSMAGSGSTSKNSVNTSSRSNKTKKSQENMTEESPLDGTSDFTSEPINNKEEGESDEEKKKDQQRRAKLLNSLDELDDDEFDKEEKNSGEDNEDEDDPFYDQLAENFPSSTSKKPSSDKATEEEGLSNSRKDQIIRMLSLPKYLPNEDNDFAYISTFLNYIQSTFAIIQRLSQHLFSSLQKCIKFHKFLSKLAQTNALPGIPTGSMGNYDHSPKCYTQLLRLKDEFIRQFPYVKKEILPEKKKTSTPDKQNNIQSNTKEDVILQYDSDILPVLEIVGELFQQMIITAMDFLSQAQTPYFHELILMNPHMKTTNQQYTKTLEMMMGQNMSFLHSLLPLLSHYELFALHVQRCDQLVRIEHLSVSSFAVFLSLFVNSTDQLQGTLHVVLNGLYPSLIQANELIALVQTMKDQLQIEMKRKISQEKIMKEQMDSFEDYNEEDKIFLKKMQQQSKEGDGKSNNNATSGENIGDKDEANKDGEKEENEEENSKDPFEMLQAKINALQKQLKLQQIQALQSLNAETLTLQREIFKEIEEIPLLCSFTQLLQEKTSGYRLATGQFDPSFVRNEQSESDSMPPPMPSTVAGSGPKELKESVLTLLAECVDSSLNLWRQMSINPALSPLDDISALDDSETSVDPSPALQTWQTLQKQLFWLKIPLHQSLTDTQKPTTKQSSAVQVIHEAFYQLHTILSSIPTEKGQEVIHIHQLALFPDYRSKTLYLASLLDIDAVRELLILELPTKVKEIIDEINSSTTK